MEIRDLTIRPIEPADGERLQRFHARLSPESRRARFMSPKPHLSTADARYLSDVDGVRHLALVAVDGDEIVGVARAVRLPEDSDGAEFAIVVADEWQRRGLGSRLLRRLAAAAGGTGVRRFRATMLSDNIAIVRLIEWFVSGAAGSGEGFSRRRLGTVTEVEFPLPDPLAPQGDAPGMLAGSAAP